MNVKRFNEGTALRPVVRRKKVSFVDMGLLLDLRSIEILYFGL